MNTDTLEQYIQAGDLQSISTLLDDYRGLAKATTSYNVSPVMLACYHKNPDVVSLILTYLDTLTLFEATAIGNMDAVKYLTENYPQLINQFSSDGFTALGLACFFNHTKIVKLLMLKGADINQPSTNAFHVYPIHSAVAANNMEIVRLLAESGAQLNVKQQSGITPLHSAAANGNLEIIILLLENEAQVNIAMNNGKLPADLARENGYNEIAAILSN